MERESDLTGLLVAQYEQIGIAVRDA